MAWNNTMVTMLRILINDINESSYQYADSRLESILAVAASYVKQEIELSYDYSINIVSPNISPDPIINGDTVYTNMVVLKAACLTDWSTFRTQALSAGIVAKCGPTTLDTIHHLEGFKQLLDGGPCAAYETLKTQLMFGNSNVCKAILSPFVSNLFDPQDLTYLYDGNYHTPIY